MEFMARPMVSGASRVWAEMTAIWEAVRSRVAPTLLAVPATLCMAIPTSSAPVAVASPR